MDNFDKGLAVVCILVLIVTIVGVTSAYQETQFIENNCIKTELANPSGESVYNCEGVNID